MIELFSMEFFQNAFVASILLALIFGIFSFFVVTRKMAFIGVGIAHSAFGGMALGILLEIDPFLTTLAFCLVTAILIGKVAKSARMSYDTSIGIFFAFTMGLASLFIALKRDYTFDFMGNLFGNILGVTRFDVIYSVIALAIFLPFAVFFLKRIMFIAFDKESAQTSGVRVDFLDNILLLFFAAITVISIKTVGIILVSALVVLPASFGMLISKNYRGVIIWGIVYSLVLMTGGLFISAIWDIPPGAVIVCGGTLVYFGVLGFKRAFLRS